MSLPVVIFISLIILTVTHGLDGVLKRCGIKKSYFLLFMAVCFAISLTPVYNINRYFSVNLFFIMSILSYIVLLSRRKKTLLVVKEITVIFFTAFIFILDTIFGLLLNSNQWFFYFKLAAIVIYCAFYIEKPIDASVCAGFSIWEMQFLLVIRNLFLDAYIYFDLGNFETAKISLLLALGTFTLSYIALLFRDRKKNKKTDSDHMELITTTEKK